MGFFSGLASEGYDRQYSDRQLVGRIVGYFKPYWLRLVWVTLLVLVIAGAGAVTPVVVSQIVDDLASKCHCLGSLFVVRDRLRSRLDLLGSQLGQAAAGDPHGWKYRADLAHRCIPGSSGA